MDQEVITRKQWAWLVAGTLFAALILVGATWTGYGMEASSPCQDGASAGYAADGTMFGDQDGNGILSGEECDWR